MNQKARHIILLVMGLCLGKSGQEDDSVAENIDVPKTIDNVSCRLGDDIANFLDSNAVVYVASSGFSLSAFEHLADELESLKSVRFVFTTPSFVPQDAVKEKIKKERREFFIPGVGEASILGGEYEIRLRNRLMQKAVAKRCAQWIKKGNVRFSSVAEFGQIQEMFVVESNSGSVVYLPFAGFTSDTLGFERGNFSSAISIRMGGVFAEPFKTRFKEVWESGGLNDVTERLAEHISNVYRDNEPELVYFFVLKSLFEEAIQDFDEDSMPNAGIGYEQSAVWKKLFDFQRDAAIAIINKLEKYNGCILADSVGLGKTFTALAVMRYHELRNKNVLVLCPKKLEANWSVYNKPMYRNNPFADEKLRYDVLCHTDIQRTCGYSNGIDLSRVNWGGYDLVVIDESHNFRNDKSNYLDRETRYQTLMRKVMREGVKTKVLMLSATPVNNRFNDLKNQLRLAYGGGADEMNCKLGGGRSVEAIFRDAECAFDAWSSNESDPRNAEALFKAIEVLGAMTPNPCLFRLFNEDGDFVEEAICPKASGGALLGESPIYRLCRGFGETDGLTASGVTTLEAALVRWSAALAGMGVRAGEGVRAFAERHYRLEALRAQSADLEKKIVREKQLDRKYELSKEKRQLEKEVSLWLK